MTFINYLVKAVRNIYMYSIWCEWNLRVVLLASIKKVLLPLVYTLYIIVVHTHTRVYNNEVAVYVYP